LRKWLSASAFGRLRYAASMLWSGCCWLPYHPAWTAGIIGEADFALAATAFLLLFMWQAPALAGRRAVRARGRNAGQGHGPGSIQSLARRHFPVASLAAAIAGSTADAVATGAIPGASDEEGVKLVARSAVNGKKENKP
jgi:hypothetical protein